MNPNIEQLYHVAGKSQRKIIGLMSGTSLDGLDVVLCTVTGSGVNTHLVVDQFTTVPYTAVFKEAVSSVFSKQVVDMEQLCLLNAWIGSQHAEMILACLANWGIESSTIDLIASHGQTVFHAPKILHEQSMFGNATLQIGDGDHIAVATGIITLSDFRQKHIAAGGEGAPLAAYGDYLLFSKKNENRIMLNIGGIANFTNLPGSLVGDKVFSTDTGPGNTIMDAFIRKHYPGHYYDDNAGIALLGTVNETLLNQLLDDAFFEKPFPKTTGPELFNLAYLKKAQQATGTEEISNADTMATLNMFTAVTITNAILKATGEQTDFHFFVSGGGMHNPLLLQNIRKRLPTAIVNSTADLGINPDAKEAVLFAVLANEAINGGATTFGSAASRMPTVSMGKISFPH